MELLHVLKAHTSSIQDCRLTRLARGYSCGDNLYRCAYHSRMTRIRNGRVLGNDILGRIYPRDRQKLLVTTPMGTSRSPKDERSRELLPPKVRPDIRAVNAVKIYQKSRNADDLEEWRLSQRQAAWTSSQRCRTAAGTGRGSCMEDGN